MFKFLLLLALAAPLAAWPHRPPGDVEQVEALIDSGLPQVAADLLPLCEVPKELADEVRLRAALERGDRKEVERALATVPASPTTCLARAVLAAERGFWGQTERAAQEGLDRLHGAAKRPRWELALVRCYGLVRQGRVATAAAVAFTQPHGPGEIPWSPFLAMLSLSDPDDPDRPRLVHDALRWDGFSPEARIQSVRQALAGSDPDAIERHFFQHGYLRQKLVGRFARRARRFVALPVLPLYGPLETPVQPVILGELARLAITRENPEQARKCQEIARSTGQVPPDARWNFARASIAMGDFFEARGNLEGFVAGFRDAYDELAWARAWTGDPHGALDALAAAPRFRDGDAVVPLARARALIDLDPPAADRLLTEQRLHLGLEADYWLLVALAAHRRGDAPAEQHAITQLVVLRKMGRINDVGCVRLALMGRELNRADLRWQLLRPGGKPVEESDFDARPLAFSALAYRLLADRAAATSPAEALQLLSRARAAILESVLGRLGVSLAEVDPALFALVPRLAFDSWYPVAQVAARILLQNSDAKRALEQLDVYLPHGDLTVAFFMLEAAALGQLGERGRTNAMVEAGTVLGVRAGIAWGAYAQLLVVTGCDEALHALARAARVLPDPGDFPDDMVALYGLGGLYVEALTTAVTTPGRGCELGRGLALAALGRDEEARALLSAACAEPGAWASPALLALVELEVREGRIAAARDRIAQMERFNILDHRVHAARALVALATGDRKGADTALLAAIARGPHAWLPFMLRARLAKLDHQDTGGWFNDASRVAPHEARMWEEIGRAKWPGGQGRFELEQCARQSLDSGQTQRAIAALELLTTRPVLAPRPRYPQVDPAALEAGVLRLLHRGAAPYDRPAAASDLAREGGLQLLELGHPAGALVLAREADAHTAALTGVAEQAGTATEPLPRPAAALLMLVALLCGPALAGRRLGAM